MEQWFDERTAGLIGGILGTALGITGGVLGSLSGICVQKGWKKPIYTIIAITIAVCSVLSIIGLVALISKQPYHVWFPLLLCGLLGIAILTMLIPVMRKRFTEYELRKMQAKDL